jgi:type IX secretion system PorP/SprF family membrane protein
MKRIFQILLVTVFLGIINISNAQDIHFSQYYSAPLILNPANSGNFNGNWRLINNYREQGNDNYDPYKTAAVAIDYPVFYYNQRGSVGFVYLNDCSAGNTLNVNGFYVSTAYFRRISEKSYLHLGLQFGMVKKTFSLENLSFPDQFDMNIGYFNPDLSTAENISNQKLFYADLAWGLVWSRRTEKFHLETGVAMFHFNMPQQVFFGVDDKLLPKYLTHAYFEMKLKNSFFIRPKFLFSYQNGAEELLLGSDLVFSPSKMQKVQNVYAGVFFRGGFIRNADGMIYKLGFKYSDFDISISYDFEFPGRITYSSPRKAFEISLSYTRPSLEIKKRIIPCEIF